MAEIKVLKELIYSKIRSTEILEFHKDIYDYYFEWANNQCRINSKELITLLKKFSIGVSSLYFFLNIDCLSGRDFFTHIERL